MQMGVNVVEVKNAADAEARRRHETLAARRHTAGAHRRADAAPFDSVRARFDTHSARVGIVPPAGDGSPVRVAALAIDPRAEQRLPGGQRGMAAGGAVRVDPTTGGRFVRDRGVPVRTRRLVGTLAGAAGRADRRRRPGVRRGRASASSSRGPPAWTRGGPSGCSTNTASTSRAIAPADVRAGGLASALDVLILADDTPRSIMTASERDGARRVRRVALATSGACARSTRSSGRRHAGVSERQQQLRDRRS